VVPWKEATRRILISDHSPVEVTLEAHAAHRVPGSS
jgi:hypothetical protein